MRLHWSTTHHSFVSSLTLLSLIIVVKSYFAFYALRIGLYYYNAFQDVDTFYASLKIRVQFKLAGEISFLHDTKTKR